MKVVLEVRLPSNMAHSMSRFALIRVGQIAAAPEAGAA
jgi:hypothetical protein